MRSRRFSAARIKARLEYLRLPGRVTRGNCNRARRAAIAGAFGTLTLNAPRHGCAIRPLNVGTCCARRRARACENVAGFRGELARRNSVRVRNRYRGIIGDGDGQITARRAVSIRVCYRNREVHARNADRIVQQRIAVTDRALPG